jgi:hypothetical protein
MKAKKEKEKTGKVSSERKKKGTASHEYETMSQIQNRYGKGREHNGSDGGTTKERGSNH